MMGIDIELRTRPLGAREMNDLLFASRDRLGAIFEEDGIGLKLESRTATTKVFPDEEHGQIFGDDEEVRWGNEQKTFWFTQQNRYYEGQPPFVQTFSLTCHNALSVSFWISGIERTGEPITSVTLHFGFISAPRENALRKLFIELLG